MRIENPQMLASFYFFQPYAKLKQNSHLPAQKFLPNLSQSTILNERRKSRVCLPICIPITLRSPGSPSFVFVPLPLRPCSASSSFSFVFVPLRSASSSLFKRGKAAVGNEALPHFQERWYLLVLNIMSLINFMCEPVFRSLLFLSAR